MGTKKARGRLRRLRWATAIALGLVIVLLAAFDARLRVARYAVWSELVDAPVRLALIADLHSCAYGQGEAELIEAIDAQSPDAILFAGDICDERLLMENIRFLLAGVADRYPCYYVSGNHECWSFALDRIEEIFREYGVTVLSGSFETITLGGQEINLCGIDDPDAARYAGRRTMDEQLQSLAGARENGRYTILLAHRPQYIEYYLEFGFDLVLSGHAHGGQWRIPILLNGLFAPDQGWFPKYAGGRYVLPRGEMIVSRGLARESTDIPRIFNRPELVIIDITPA